jgi:hypothetical protein
VYDGKCLPYPLQRLCHASLALSPVRALLVRIPLGPRPSLHRLRGVCSCRCLRSEFLRFVRTSRAKGSHRIGSGALVALCWYFVKKVAQLMMRWAIAPIGPAQQAAKIIGEGL